MLVVITPHTHRIHVTDLQINKPSPPNDQVYCPAAVNVTGFTLRLALDRKVWYLCLICIYLSMNGGRSQLLYLREFEPHFSIWYRN